MGDRRRDAEADVERAKKERDDLRKRTDEAIERVDEFNKTLFEEYREENGVKP